jgi:hypothetical protein
MSTTTCVSHLLNFIENFQSGRETERNKKIVKRYLGLDGLGGSSMELAGEPFQLTRESVRQILKKYKKALDESKISHAPLRDALNTLDKLAPISSKAASEKLSEQGIVDADFAVEGLLVTADFLGLKKTKNELVAVKDKSFRSQEYSIFFVTNDQIDLPKNIFSRALKETSHNGASSVVHLSESISAPKATKERLVRDIVDSIPGIVWLDAEQNWFYFLEQARNRVLSRVNKIFSVFSCASFESTKEGIRRSINKHNDSISRRLPNTVLESLFKSEGLELNDGVLSKVDNRYQFEDAIDMDKRKIVDFELQILDVLSKHDSDTIQEVELENQIVSNTHDKFFYSMALNYSPLIVRIKRGTYKATGVI